MPIQPRTYRTRSGRVLTDADIERIAEEVATTDLDPTRAKVLYPPEAPQPGFWDDPSETVVDPADVDAVVASFDPFEVAAGGQADQPST